MLAAESSLVVGHTLKVIVVDPPATGEDFFAALRAQVASRLPRVPRFRQRLVQVPFGLARPVWADDPSFDLDHHVRRAPPPETLDTAGLRRLVAEHMVERLDRDRPLWSVDVVEQLEDGRVALLWKVHHSVADGLGVLAIAEQLLWGEDPEPPPAALPLARPLPSGARLVAGALEDHGRSLAGWLSGSRRRGVPAVSFRATRPEVQVVARELLPVSPRSPLDTRVGRERRVAFVERPLEEVRSIAHAASAEAAASAGDSRDGPGHDRHKVTVNDVVLGAVAGGLREWLRARHAELADLRVSVPVALHHGSEPHVLGNDVCDVYLALPIQEPDPGRRLLRISAEMRRRKEDGDAEALDRLSRVVGPAGELLGDLGAGPRTFGLAVSNVPGPGEAVSVAGGRVRTLHSIAEVAQRHALRVTVVSYDGRISFGLCADADAVPDLDLMAAGVDRAVAELAAALA